MGEETLFGEDERFMIEEEETQEDEDHFGSISSTLTLRQTETDIRRFLVGCRSVQSGFS